MPWRELEPMEQRLELIRENESGLVTMTELAAQTASAAKRATSGSTAYEVGGARGLAGSSRRPHQSPHATDEDIVRAILALRRRHPRWGPEEIAGRWPRRRAPRRGLACAIDHRRRG